MYKSTTSMPWYSLNHGSTDVGDPNNYTLIGNNPPNCPSPKLYVCAIQAQDNNGHPILTDINLLIEIANDVNSRIDSNNVRLGPTR
jgi:hypothetical protein